MQSMIQLINQSYNQSINGAHFKWKLNLTTFNLQAWRHPLAQRPPDLLILPEGSPRPRPRPPLRHLHLLCLPHCLLPSSTSTCLGNKTSLLMSSISPASTCWNNINKFLMKVLAPVGALCVMMPYYRSARPLFEHLCQSVTNIFEYIGHEYIFGHSFLSIFLLWIYSAIRSCQICLYEYIRTFVGECVRV